MLKKYEPEISKVLTLSTAHITEKTAELLDKEPDSNYLGLCVYPKSEYGYYIEIGEYLDQSLKNHIPEDLFIVLAFANSMDCSILCLDCDAVECPFLPTYDW